MYNKAYVEIINACNLSCSFCPKTKRPFKTMTKEEFAFVLDKVLPLTKYVYLHVVGEPTIHPEFEEIIKIGVGKGAKIAVTTNGTKIERLYNAVKENPIYKVNVSLTMTGGNDVNVSEYAKDVAKYAKPLSDIGIIVVLRLWNKGGNDSKNGEVIKALQSVFGDFSFSDKGSVKIKENLYIEGDDVFEWDRTEEKASGFCMALKDQFGVLSDGTVIPCCIDHDGEIALGNIFEKELAEILQSERAVNLREGLKKRTLAEPRCRHCGFNAKFDK